MLSGNEPETENTDEKKPTHFVDDGGRKFSKKTMIIIIISITSVVLIGLLIVGLILKHNYDEHQRIISETIDIENFYDGISIQGIDVSGKSRDEAASLVKAIEPSLRENISIDISFNGESYKFTQNDLNFKFDTDEVLDEAYQVGRNGDRESRYQEVLNLKNNPRSFNISHEIILDDNAINDFTDNLAQKVHVDMTPPYVSEFHPNSSNMFVFHEGIPGADLDKKDLSQQLFNAVKEKNYILGIKAKSIVIPVEGDMSDLKSQTVLLSEFSTVSTNNSNADTNMALSLGAINGTIVKPGTEFSFNNATGDTTKESNGYLPAAAISNGKIVQEVGGGICQSATTVYGAALRADMKITRRVNHLWPSNYVPVGQDATVDYPYTDFRFQNDSKYPVFIWANMNGKTLTVRIYGWHPPDWDKIEVSSHSTGGGGAAGEKNFYKDGQVVKTEAILSSSYKEGQQ